MFQVSQYYRRNRSTSDPVKQLRAFPEFEQALAFARAEYERLSRIPESERVQVAVIEQSGRLAYMLPDFDLERS